MSIDSNAPPTVPPAVPNPNIPPATHRERVAWCFYDFANSGYTTVILTAIFNAYFVGVVAKNLDQIHPGSATLCWTLGMAAANALVLLSAPVLGAIADYSASKKKFLMASTIGCVIFTALLALVGPGDIALGLILVIVATVMFAAGENFIASFLPELATPETMGRLSGYGWTTGYLGGLLTLGLCILYIQSMEASGATAADYVPGTNLIVATIFALAALPTLLFLKERAQPNQRLKFSGYVRTGFTRVSETLHHARHYKDLFRFLGALTIYYCGINTVIVLAAVYAQEVMGFTTRDTLILILVVNVTAAAGAFGFGQIQDRIGSKTCIAITLCVWIAAIVLAYLAQSETQFWIAANLIGIALGASQSAGRAMVGEFSPPSRSGEFFGLWGLAGKLAAIIGPLTYGAVNFLFSGNHRLAILSTLLFFIMGLLVLMTVNEPRGREAAKIDRWT
ncbi:MAG: MFS transporter [Gammaproteobacteria bacterium]|nr:MFS transporter [Gammaproteobacteria bacterium]